MPTDRINDAIEHVRGALRPGSGLADGDLLGSFIDRHDETAFAALVRSHGPMVWGVCRRLLGHHDAEDAFQATFIVLVRKAESIAPRDMVAHWLYGVAHQTAMQARRAAARRRAREVQVTAVPDAEATRPEQRDDLQLLLDRELNRLPANYRAVIVLCDLEGRTRKEAARQLGMPEGTVAGRLARARAMLATRLTRRGISLSGAALAAVLSHQAASAGVPASVVTSAIEAASGYAAGRVSAATPAAVALTEGVLRAMLMSKFKAATAVILLAAASCCSAWLAYQAIASPGPGTSPQPVANASSKPARAPVPVPAEKPVPEELRPFQGSWKMTLCDSEDEGLGAEQKQVWKWRWAVKGDKIVWGRQGEEWELSLKVDPGKEPKEIDLTYLSGPFKGQKCLGMYEWGGTDGKGLNISIQDPGADVPRPTSISMRGGGKTSLIFLRPADPVDAKKELTALEGTWTFNIVQTDPTDGWPRPTGKGPDKAGQGSERRWEIKGNEVTWTGPDGQEVKASFTIDPSKVPKHIDFTFLSGPNKGEKCEGVYERGGVDDTVLWLCVVDPGKKAPRPKDISYESYKGRSMIGLAPHRAPAKR